MNIEKMLQNATRPTSCIIEDGSTIYLTYMDTEESNVSVGDPIITFDFYNDYDGFGLAVAKSKSEVMKYPHGSFDLDEDDKDLFKEVLGNRLHGYDGESEPEVGDYVIMRDHDTETLGLYAVV